MRELINIMPVRLMFVFGLLCSMPVAAFNTAVFGDRNAQDYLDETSYQVARSAFESALGDGGINVAGATATLEKECKDSICSGVSRRVLLKDQRSNNPDLDLLITFKLAYSENMGPAVLRRSVMLTATVLDTRSNFVYASWTSAPEEFVDASDCRAECRSAKLTRALINVANSSGSVVAEKIQSINTKTTFVIGTSGLAESSLTLLEKSLTSLNTYESGDLELRSKSVLPVWFHSELNASYRFRSSIAGGRLHREIQGLVEAQAPDTEVEFASDSNQFFVVSPQNLTAMEYGVLASVIALILVLTFMGYRSQTLQGRSASVAIVISLVVLSAGATGYRNIQREANEEKLADLELNQAETEWWESLHRSGTLADYNEYLDQCGSCQFDATAKDAIEALDREQDLQLKMITRSVQSALVDLGYDSVPTDGEADSRTVEAAREFQTSEGLVVDGKVDGTLLRNLNASINREAQALVDLQSNTLSQLLYLGYTKTPPNEDVDKGDLIDRSLSRFRKARGTTAQNVTEQETLDALAIEFRARKDTDAWRAALALNTIDGYENYRVKFEAGQYHAAAEDKIDDLNKAAAYREELALFKQQADPKGVLISLSPSLGSLKSKIAQVLQVCDIRIVRDVPLAHQVYPNLQITGSSKEALLDGAFFSRLTVELVLRGTKKQRLAQDVYQVKATSRIDKASSLEGAIRQLSDKFKSSKICSRMK